ncbi:MAG TPA: alpha/beta hydrolase family protein [Candidatus Acidoferrum sp.]|nr:alpha/beta hydrolase family protein [Candidatus Acidoferrum sp.]
MNRLRRAAWGPLLLAILWLPGVARATGRAECNSLHSKILARDVPYCVLLPPSYDADKARRFATLYLLHGLGDNEQMLIHSGGINLVEDLWEQHQLGEFLIVTPAARASFYINSRNGRQRYEDFFLREFMPGIERRYRTLPGRRARGIAGISMGGYGALHIAFQHANLFGVVGAHSAALIEKLPKVSAKESRQISQLRILGDAFGNPFDAAFWKENDPLTIARTANLAGLKIYFDCGAQDDYGFNEGAEALDKLLTARHIPHEFHLYPGGHDWTYFAEHLPGMLQFADRALESGTTRNSHK